MHNPLRLLTFLAFVALSFPARAMTLQEFVQLEKDQQGFYLMGVLDTEIIDASYGLERSECVRNWGLKGAYSYIAEWYNRAPNDEDNLSFNVALLVISGISETCSSEGTEHEE